MKSVLVTALFLFVLFGNVSALFCPLDVAITTGTTVIEVNLLLLLCDEVNSVVVDKSSFQNLLPLNGLKKVRGAVTIRDNSQLTVIQLNNLEDVAGNFRIENNADLVTVNLPKLQILQKNFSVVLNSKLDAVHLVALKKVQGSAIEIVDNAVLQDFGASNVIFDTFGDTNYDPLPPHLTIRGNPILENIQLFAATNDIVMDELPLYFELEDFNVASDLSSFFRFAAAFSHVHVRNCANLQTLHGLEQVTSVSESILVENCPSLTKIEGLGSTSVQLVESSFHSLVLRNLSSFINLETIQTWPAATLAQPLLLDISDCPILLHIDHLQLVSGQLASLVLHNLPILNSLTGIQSFTGVLGNLTMSRLDTIANLGAFDSGFTLTSASHVRLELLESLSSILAFHSVTDVASLAVVNCSSLTQFGGFSALVHSHGPLLLSDLPLLDRFTAVTDSDLFPAVTNVDGDLTLVGLPQWNSISATLFPLLVAVTGSLHLDTLGPAQLNGFANLAVISGDLRVTNLNSLIAFSSSTFGLLNSVTAIDVSSCANIAQIDSIASQLSAQSLTVAGSVTFSQNPSLASVDFLDKVSSIGGSLTIDTCGALVTIAFQATLASIGGSLNIASNGALTTITSPTITIGGNVDIRHNSQLSSVSGVAHFRTGGVISITYCDALVDFDVVPAATGNCSGFVLTNNALLESFSGFSSFQFGGDILLRNLPALLTIDALTNSTATSLNSIHIENCLKLKSIPPFDSIATLATSMTVTNCAALHTLHTPPSVSTVLLVNDCDSLTHIVGLASTVSIDAVRITDNAILAYLDLFRYTTDDVVIANDLLVHSNPLLNNVTESFAHISNVELLSVSDTAAPSLDFSSLTTVNSDFLLRRNAANSINLTKLDEIHGVLDIFDNVYLSAISLPSCTDIDDIVLRNNAQLESFVASGSSFVLGASIAGPIDAPSECVDRYLALNDDIDSSECRRRGSLVVVGNPLLTTLAVGSTLGIQTIPGSVYVHDTALVTLDGLSTISSIGGNCSFYNNTELTSFSALASLSIVGGFIDLLNSPLVCTSELGPFATLPIRNQSPLATSFDCDLHAFLSSINTQIDITWNQLDTMLPDAHALVLSSEWSDASTVKALPQFAYLLQETAMTSVLQEVSRWDDAIAVMDALFVNVTLFAQFDMSITNQLPVIAVTLLHNKLVQATSTLQLLLCQSSVSNAIFPTIPPPSHINLFSSAIDSPLIDTNLPPSSSTGVFGATQSLGPDFFPLLSFCHFIDVGVFPSNPLRSSLVAQQSANYIDSPLVVAYVSSSTLPYTVPKSFTIFRGNRTTRAQCVNFDQTSSSWVSTGCTTSVSNATHTVCQCPITTGSGIAVGLVSLNLPFNVELPVNLTVNTAESVEETASFLRQLVTAIPWTTAGLGGGDNGGDGGGGGNWTSPQDTATSLVETLSAITTYTLWHGITPAGQTDTLSTLDELFEPSSLDLMKSANKTGALTGVVEDVGFSMLVDQPCGSHLTPSTTSRFSMTAVSSTTPAGTFQSGNTWFTLPAAFSSKLPASTCHSLSFVEYKINPFVSVEEAQETESTVASFSVRNVTVRDLDEASSIEFTLTRFDLTRDSVCAFWNTNESRWSTVGCTTVSRVGATVVCRSNHLTNFALIFDARGSSVSAAVPLEVLTYIACISSMVCCFLFVAVFLYLEKLRSGPILLNMQLCVALFLTNLVFLTGIERTSDASLCTAIAFVLYYLLLVCFLWMVCIGHRLFASLVRVEVNLNSDGQSAMVHRYSLFAWGLPLLAVAVCAAVEFSTDERLIGFGSASSCWISSTMGLVGAFLVPVALAVLFNLVVIILVVRALSASRNLQKASMNRRDVVRQVIIYTGLVASLGLTWLFGFMAIATGEVAFWYLFVLFNGGQGILLFVVYVMRSRVVEAFREKRRASPRRPVFHSPLGSGNNGTNSTGLSSSSNAKRLQRAVINVFTSGKYDQRSSKSSSRNISNEDEREAFACQLSPSLNSLRSAALQHTARRLDTDARGASSASNIGSSEYVTQAQLSPLMVAGLSPARQPSIMSHMVQSEFTTADVTESMLLDVEANMSMYMDGDTGLYIEDDISEDDHEEDDDLGSFIPFMLTERRAPSALGTSTASVSVADFHDEEIFIDADTATLDSVEGVTQQVSHSPSRRRASTDSSNPNLRRRSSRV